MTTVVKIVEINSNEDIIALNGYSYVINYEGYTFVLLSKYYNEFSY